MLFILCCWILNQVNKIDTTCKSLEERKFTSNIYIEIHQHKGKPHSYVIHFNKSNFCRGLHFKDIITPNVCLPYFMQLEGDQRFIPTFGKIKRHCSNSYTSVDFLDLTRINWLKNLWTQTVNSYFLFSSPELKAKWDFFLSLIDRRQSVFMSVRL